MKSKKNVKTKKYLLIRKRKILKNKEKKRTLIYEILLCEQVPAQYFIIFVAWLNCYKTLMPCVLRQHHKYILHESFVKLMHTYSKLYGACTNHSVYEWF